MYKSVEQFLQEVFPDVTWVFDKRVPDGCSLRRPGAMADMGSHVVVVEIDEDQHAGGDYSCDNKAQHGDIPGHGVPPDGHGPLQPGRL